MVASRRPTNTVLLTKAISVWRVRSTSRNYRNDLRVDHDLVEIGAGEEVKQFDEADRRGNILIRWNGHTYLARESDLKQKPAPKAGE